MLTRKFAPILILLSFFCLGMQPAPYKPPVNTTPAPIVQEPSGRTDLVIASAESSSSASSYPAANTIDGNIATYWQGESAKNPWWLVLDMGKPCILTYVLISWRSDNEGTAYVVQGSNDNNNWVTLSKVNSVFSFFRSPSRSRAVLYQRDFSVSGTYRYVRIYIEQAVKSCPVIYEVQVSGNVAPSPDTQGPDLVIISPKEWEVIR